MAALIIPWFRARQLIIYCRHRLSRLRCGASGFSSISAMSLLCTMLPSSSIQVGFSCPPSLTDRLILVTDPCSLIVPVGQALHISSIPSPLPMRHTTSAYPRVPSSRYCDIEPPLPQRYRVHRGSKGPSRCHVDGSSVGEGGSFEQPT
jgi:hypothetical protein